MDKYAETKEILSNMAAVKMDMNSHKQKIESWEPNALLEMLRSEVEELEEAVSKGSILGVIEESADVMNFLVALTHQQINVYRNRKS